MEDIVDTSVALAHAPLPPTSSLAHMQPPPSSPPPPHDLFAGIVYFLAPSLALSRRASVDALLLEYGGEPVDEELGTRDERLTMVVAPHGAVRYEGWEVVEEREHEGRTVDVVTDLWVERSVLLGKLQSPHHYSIDPALLFSGITACAVASDFSSCDVEVLAAGIIALGGQWRTGLTRDVTHLFALKTGTPKYETAVHFQEQTGVRILVPHWFDDSVRLGGGLPTTEYEWPEPRVLLQRQGGAGAEGKKVKGSPRKGGGGGAGEEGERDPSNDTALSALTPPLPEAEQIRKNIFTSSAYTPAAGAPRAVEHGTLALGVAGINPYTRLSPGGSALSLSLPSPHGSPYPPSQPLKGKRILISRSLGLSGGRLGALHAQIARAGGTVVRFEGDDDEHESESASGDPAEEGSTTTTTEEGGWMVRATFRPGERGYKPLLAYPPPPPPHAHPLHSHNAHELDSPEKPITRILPRLPPAERRRRRFELAAVGECDVLITRWRWGAAYVRAVRERKTVATLAWVFFLLMPVHNGGGDGRDGRDGRGGRGRKAASARPAPTEQLLHYPVPKGPVEGFSQHVITVTNYTGEAREYLKKLINAMGGTFTPSMSGQNTVLIAAYVKGTKAEKARLWSIPIVNHTWLEDCFAQWRNLTMALEKYIVFPPGVDFSAMLGSRGVFVGAGRHPVPGGGLGMSGVSGAGVATGMSTLAPGTTALAPGTKAAAEQHEAELGRLEAEAEELLEEYDELADAFEDETRVEKRRNADGTEEWVPVAVPSPPVPVEEDSQQRQDEEQESQPAQPGGTAAEAAEMKEVVHDLIEVQDDDDDFEMQQPEIPEREKSPSPPPPVKKKVKPTAPKPGTSKSKAAAKEKAKATAVDPDVLNFSSSDSEPEVVTPVKKGPPRSTKKAQPKKKHVSEDDEEEERVPVVEEEGSEVEIVPAKKVSSKSKPASTVTAVSKTKKKTVVSSDEEEEEGAEEDAMDVDSPNPKSKSKAPAVAAKQVNGKGPSKSKAPIPVEDDDEPAPARTPNGHSPRKNGADRDKTPPVPSSSLLAPRPKADARTRVVRRKAPSAAPPTPGGGAGASAGEPAPTQTQKRMKIIFEDSEQSEEVVVPKAKGKGRAAAAAVEPKEAPPTKNSAAKDAKKAAPKAKVAAKGRSRVMDTPESEDEEEDEQQEEELEDESEPEPEPALAPRKKLVRRVTAERGQGSSKPPSKPAPTSRKQVPQDVDEDSDDSLPDVSEIISKATKAAAAAASKPKSKGKAKEVEAKPKSSKKKPEPVETETDEDSEPRVITVKPKSKATSKTTATTVAKNAEPGPSTPRRTLSVLMPSLNLSGKPKSTAAKDASKSKTTSKTKKPPAEEPENEEQDEEDVSNVAGSKLNRTGSLRVASGQVSTPSSSVVVVKKASSKAEKSRSKRTADEALSSDEEDSRRMPPPPPQASTSTHNGAPPRRTAAAKATERLHTQIMPDVIAYESQKRRAAEQARKGRPSMEAFKVAGEGSLEELRVQPNSSQSQSRNGKRASQGADETDDEEEEPKPVKKKRRVSDEVEVVVKKGKTKQTQPPAETSKEVPSKPSIHIMTTQVTLSDDVLRALLKLGIKMTSRAGECTHLIAKQVVRTEKFLCALTRAPWVVTEAWALNCVAQKKVLPEKDYLLKDKAGEEKYGVKLADSLRRAEKLQGSLFKGHTFYVTSRVPVDAKLLKNVINACGGQVSTQTPTARIINVAPDARHVISCPDDISIWRPLANAGIPVYTQELLLNGVLRQQVDYDSTEFILKA